MLWIKEEELANSVVDLKSSRSIQGTKFPDFELLDARIASALNKIIPNSYFRKRVSLEEWRAQKQDRFLRGCLLDLWVLPGHWHQRFCTWLCRLVNCGSSEWQHSGIGYKMGRNFVINGANPTWWDLGKFVQAENARVWEAQDHVRIVQLGDLSERVKTWLSQTEDNGKNKCWAWVKIAELWIQKWWNWVKHFDVALTKDKEIVGDGKPQGSVWKETSAFSGTVAISVQKWWHSLLLLQNKRRNPK